MRLRVGQQVASVVDATTMIVVRAPGEDVTLTCGGVDMIDPKETPRPAGASGPVDPAHADGTQLGRRYADETLGIELLCTKAGQGTVAVNGTPLPRKESKPLPASD